MEVLIATIVGALLTGLVGLVALVRGKSMERDHWVRERRLQAYADFLASVDTISSLPDSTEAAWSAAAVPLAATSGLVTLLGPDTVDDAARVLRGRIVERQEGTIGADPVLAARLAFVTAAQAALGE